MRQRFIQDRETGELVPVEQCRPKERMHYIQPDIGGYKSMASGQWISSRSKHREELRRHGLIEVGNEINAITKNRPKAPDRELRKRQIADAINNR